MMQMEAMVYTVYTALEDRDTPSRRPVYRLSDASSRRFCLIRAVSMYRLVLTQHSLWSLREGESDAAKL